MLRGSFDTCRRALVFFPATTRPAQWVRTAAAAAATTAANSAPATAAATLGRTAAIAAAAAAGGTTTTAAATPGRTTALRSSRSAAVATPLPAAEAAALSHAAALRHSAGLAAPSVPGRQSETYIPTATRGTAAVAAASGAPASAGRAAAPSAVAHEAGAASATAGRRPVLLVICGPPCSGKGSLAALLSRRLQLQHISVGDLLREALQRGSDSSSNYGGDRSNNSSNGSNTDNDDCSSSSCSSNESGSGNGPSSSSDVGGGGHCLSSEAAAALQRGNLVADELVFDLLRRELRRHLACSDVTGSPRSSNSTGSNTNGGSRDRSPGSGTSRSDNSSTQDSNRCAAGVVLEGFPRTEAQVDFLADSGMLPDLVVSLQVSDADVLRQRMRCRLVDPTTQKVYGAANPPPAALLSCLQKRSDDTAEVLQRRLSQYESAWACIKARFEYFHGLQRQQQQQRTQQIPVQREHEGTPQARTPQLLQQQEGRPQEKQVEQPHGDSHHQLQQQKQQQHAVEFTQNDELIREIDGTRTIEEVYSDVLAFMRERLGERLLSSADHGAAVS